MEMQTQLYGFSAICAFVLYGIQVIWTSATQTINFCTPQVGWQCECLGYHLISENDIICYMKSPVEAGPSNWRKVE